MSASTVALPSFFNTDADFRTYCQAIHDALTAAGWVQTGDSGQINLATVAKPAAINTAQGYEIWRMADALQGTVPYFMKIEYGSAAAVDRPSLWHTVGSGSNGSGTITGTGISSRFQVGQAVSDSAGNTRNCFFSGDTNRFAMYGSFVSGAATGRFWWGVERTYDSSGNPTSDGAMYLARCVLGTGQDLCQVIPQGTATSTGTNGQQFLNPGLGNAGQFTVNGANVAVVPFIYFFGKPFFSKNWLTYKDADITEGAVIATVTGGGTVNYMPFKSSSASAKYQDGTTGALAMVYQ